MTLMQMTISYFLFQEIEGTQYDILITGDPVVFDGEKVVSGDNTSLGEVSSFGIGILSD